MEGQNMFSKIQKKQLFNQGFMRCYQRYATFEKNKTSINRKKNKNNFSLISDQHLGNFWIWNNQPTKPPVNTLQSVRTCRCHICNKLKQWTYGFSLEQNVCCNFHNTFHSCCLIIYELISFVSFIFLPFNGLLLVHGRCASLFVLFFNRFLL